LWYENEINFDACELFIGDSLFRDFASSITENLIFFLKFKSHLGMITSVKCNKSEQLQLNMNNLHKLEILQHSPPHEFHFERRIMASRFSHRHIMLMS